MQTILILVHKGFGQFSKGQVVKVQSDEHGIPLITLWRRRLKDAEKDSCCEVVTKETIEKRIAESDAKAKAKKSKKSSKK